MSTRGYEHVPEDEETQQHQQHQQQQQQPQQVHVPIQSYAMAFPAAAVMPAALPAPAVIPPDPTPLEFEQRINERRVLFQMDTYFRDGWNLITSNLCVVLLAVLSWLAVAVLLAFGVDAAHRGLFHSHRDWDYEYDGNRKSFWLNLLFSIVSEWLITILFIMPAEASAYLAVFHAMRTNGTLRYKDFFTTGYGRLWDCVKFGTAMYFITLLLEFLFFVPALIFLFLATFALPIYLDQNVSFCKSVVLSKRLVAKYPCNILGFYLACLVVAILGFLCLGVGLLIALPVIHGARVFMYHHLAGVKGCPLAPCMMLPSFQAPPQPPMAPYPAHTVQLQPIVARSTYVVAPSAPVVNSAPVTNVEPVPVVASGPYAFYPQPQPLPQMYSTALHPHAQAQQASSTYVPIAAPSYGTH